MATRANGRAKATGRVKRGVSASTTRAVSARGLAAPATRRAKTAASIASTAREGIARWPELKLEIVRRFASAWSRVMSRQPGLAYYYVEGFSGAGVHVGEANGELVAGSPLNALHVEPPFHHHFLLDLDGGRASVLRRHVDGRPDVTLLEGDGSELLLRDVLPRVRAEDYRRALCVLDPCGTRLDWRVLEAAGRLKTIDLFVSLPLTDEQGRALWTRADGRDAARLDRVWGDDSWRELARAPEPANIAAAFRRRLRAVGRFENVLELVPVCEKDGAGIGHLFFASRSDTANHVLEDILAGSRG